MKEYTKPQINEKELHPDDVIAVSNGANREILNVHLRGAAGIFSHEWKDTWN